MQDIRDSYIKKSTKSRNALRTSFPPKIHPNKGAELSDEVETFSDSDKVENISDSYDEYQISSSDDENFTSTPYDPYANFMTKKILAIPLPSENKRIASTTLEPLNLKKQKYAIEYADAPISGNSQVTIQNIQSPYDHNQNSFIIDLTASDDEKENSEKIEFNPVTTIIQPKKALHLETTKKALPTLNNNQIFFSQSKSTQITSFLNIGNSSPILPSQPVQFQKNSNLLSLIEEKGYTNNYSHLYGFYAPCLSENGELKTLDKRYCPKTSALFSYVCRNSKNKTVAFVIKNINDANMEKKLSQDWPNWYKNKFQKNSANSKDNLSCIFIFDFNSQPAPKNDEDCLMQIGKLLRTCKAYFPCNFMLSYDNKLSDVYSSDNAIRIVKEKNAIEDSEILGAIVQNYQKLLRDLIEFEKNDFSQSLKDKISSNKESQFYKNTFSPNQFIVINNYYKDISFQLTNVKKRLDSYRGDDERAKLLHKQIEGAIDETQEIIEMLEKIREEYVGNKEKEKSLLEIWKKLKNDQQAMKSIADILSANTQESMVWLTNITNNFAAITRIHETTTSPMFKIPYYKEIGTGLKKDFSSNTLNYVNSAHTIKISS